MKSSAKPLSTFAMQPGLDPNDRKIGQFLCNSRCDDNIEAIQRWLTTCLSDPDNHDKANDLEKLKTALSSALFTRVPGQFLKDFQ